MVQRQRLLSYKQETMVQLHPGLLQMTNDRMTNDERTVSFDVRHSSIRYSRRPCEAAWSARLPVTQEIVGSNPIGDAETVKS